MMGWTRYARGGCVIVVSSASSARIPELDDCESDDAEGSNGNGSIPSLGKIPGKGCELQDRPPESRPVD
eukprot:gene12598-biopygen6061